MTISHKDLTGSDLHEIKGADTATAGQVPVSDGAGTAPFGKLTHTSLQTTGNPYGAQLFHAREEQASGISSTTSSAAGWQVTALNTIRTNEITSASMAASTITLPAGTYHFDARATSFATINSTTSLLQLRLMNTTSGSVILYGPCTRIYLAASVGGHQVEAYVRGRFTIAVSSGIRLEQNTWALGGTGAGGGLGPEVYGDVMFWKIA